MIYIFLQRLSEQHQEFVGSRNSEMDGVRRSILRSYRMAHADGTVGAIVQQTSG